MPAYTQQTPLDYTASAASDVQKKLQAAAAGAGAFDEGVADLLLQYLEEQVKGNSVDIDADLELLKLFLVHPAKASADAVAKVLVKGVMASPSPFFTGATTMIPADLRDDANVAAVVEAGFLLQSCLFEEFWTKDLSFAKSVAGFEQSVRAYILETVSKSHNAIAASVLKAKLNISDAELKDAVAAEGWAIEGDLIAITANESNQMRPAKVQESIEFEDVLKVIHTLSR